MEFFAAVYVLVVPFAELPARFWPIVQDEPADHFIIPHARSAPSDAKIGLGKTPLRSN